MACYYMLKLAQQKGVHSLQIFGTQHLSLIMYKDLLKLPIHLWSLLHFTFYIFSPYLNSLNSIIYREYNMEVGHLSKKGLELFLGHHELIFSDFSRGIEFLRRL